MMIFADAATSILTWTLAVGAVIAAGLTYRAWVACSYWRRKGIPHEGYLSYLYTSLVRFRHEDVYQVLEELHSRYGPVYGTYSGFRPVLRVTTLDGVKDALVRRFSVNHERTLFVPTGSPLWDNNILALDYHRWKSVRPLSGLAFTPSRLKAMKCRIESIADRLAAQMLACANDNKDLNPALYSQCYTIEVTASIAFSLEVDALANPENPFVRNGNNMFGPSVGLSLLSAAPWLVKYIPFVHFPPKSVTDFFQGFTETLIKQRRQSGRPSTDPDILDLWLEEQKNRPEFTDELIAAQTFVFFVVGFETSAYTLFLTLYLLASNEEAQELAYNDMLKHAKDPNNITFEEYGRMKAIEACFTETLRLYPTDYVLDRMTIAPCTIADVSLDAGIGVQVPIPALHRDPTVFPQPHCYRPQRYIEELNVDPVDSATQFSAMLAFGEGPKGCMGRRLAYLQLTIALCSILKRARLVASEASPRVETGKLPFRLAEGALFVPLPKDPLYIRLEPRN